jgi:hypothetical protein
MTTNKKTDRNNAFGNPSARGFNFFIPRALRLLGALGNAPINSSRTLQHISKPPRANARNQRLVKELQFFPRTTATLFGLVYTKI